MEIFFRAGTLYSRVLCPKQKAQGLTPEDALSIHYVTVGLPKAAESPASALSKF